MIVGNLIVEWPVMVLWPIEAHSPLPIDANAELTVPVATKSFKTIARQQHQVNQTDRCFQNIQTPFCLLLECLKFLHALAHRETLRTLIAVLGRNFRQTQAGRALL